MRQRQSFSGFGFLILIMLMIWVGMIFFGKNAANQMTQQEFLKEVETGNITSAAIKPNKETPTGELLLMMKDGSEESIYVSDITQAEDLFQEQQIPYVMWNVPQENYFFTIVLPIILSAVVLVAVFMAMNARAAGGGANARMMNFGKSRAKMSREAGKTNFDKVAGLQEEKEELEELVDFLKDPKKYTTLGAEFQKV